MSDSRKRFEEWAGSAPFEYDLSRFPEHHIKHSWPGQYRRIEVQFAWQAWSTRDSEVERLREALMFYADALNYEESSVLSRNGFFATGPIPVEQDRGKRARAALLSSQDKESA